MLFEFYKKAICNFNILAKRKSAKQFLLLTRIHEPLARDRLQIFTDYRLQKKGEAEGPFTPQFSPFTENMFLIFPKYHSFVSELRIKNFKNKNMRHYHHHSSEFKCGKRSNSKVRGFVFGFFLLAAGTILILGNTGTIDKGLFQYIFSWQSLLISFGILILSGGFRQNWFGSMLMITIGTIFLLDEIYQFKTGVANMIWPAVLIIIGLAIIGKIFFPKKKVIDSKSDKYSGFGEFKGEKNGDEYVNVSRVFSGINLESNSENFKGGQLSFVFGGGEIDLRGAKLADGINILKVECVFGGVKIFIPDDWDVNLETSGVFGGFSDERRHIPYENVDRTRKLVIKAEAVFGGGEITN